MTITVDEDLKQVIDEDGEHEIVYLLSLVIEQRPVRRNGQLWRSRAPTGEVLAFTADDRVYCQKDEGPWERI
jgi:hypothetical protein